MLSRVMPGRNVPVSAGVTSVGRPMTEHEEEVHRAGLFDPAALGGVEPDGLVAALLCGLRSPSSAPA